jgi:hypothetical protein
VIHDMAIGDDGTLHVAAASAGQPNVRVLRGTVDPTRYPSAWDWNLVWEWEAESDEPLVDVAIAVDRTGSAILGALQSGGIWFVRAQDGVVASETLEAWPPTTAGPAGPSVAVVVDPEGAAHLAWLRPAAARDHGSVRYATNRDGSWQTETVSTGDAWVDLAVDGRGSPHVFWRTEQRDGEPENEPASYATFSELDGIDENCDGVDGVDADGDGHASRETGGDDPDDSVPSR